MPPRRDQKGPGSGHQWTRWACASLQLKERGRWGPFSLCYGTGSTWPRTDLRPWREASALSDLPGRRSCLLLGLFQAQPKPHFPPEGISSSTISLSWTLWIILDHIWLLNMWPIINCLFKSMSPGDELFLLGKTHVLFLCARPVTVPGTRWLLKMLTARGSLWSRPDIVLVLLCIYTGPKTGSF